MDGNWINTLQVWGHNEWAAFEERAPQWWRGDICFSRRKALLIRRRKRCSLGGDEGDIMCGEAGCLHCGFTSATSPSIVWDYYQLFNYSDDIYQGQLYRVVSCRENGQSVLLLHLEEEVCCWSCSSGEAVMETFIHCLCRPVINLLKYSRAVNC